MNDHVLITGGSRGIGAATVLEFARAGYDVAFTWNSREDAALDVVQQAQALNPGGRFVALHADVSDSAQVNAAVQETLQQFGSLQALMCCAGIAQQKLFTDLTDEDWHRMMGVDLDGVFYACRAVLPGMVERNRGHVINIGSTAGSWPYAGGNVYGATKAFVRQFSLNLRTDLHGTAIRVTDVEPGLVGGTEFSNVRFKGDDAKADKTYENANALTPEDITETVWWVANLPKHVNINTVEMMPVSQTYAGLSVHRG